MEIEQRTLDEIRPYENNPRQNDVAVDAVADSLKEFGFRQPIVVDEHGVIVCGHTRFKAAKKLGLKTVPVHVAKVACPISAPIFSSRRLSRGSGITRLPGSRDCSIST